MNRNSWKALSPAERKVLWEAMPSATATATHRGHVVEDRATLADAKKHNIRLVEMEAKLAPVMSAFNAEERKVVADEGRKLGVKEPETIIEAHIELIAKWEGLTKGIGDDSARFAGLLRQHVYSKLDPESW